MPVPPHDNGAHQLPIIFGRPTNPKYRSSDLTNTQPALVFKDGDFTYLCWLYGSKIKQNWKICRVQNAFELANHLDYDPISDTYNPYIVDENAGTIAYLYPYGCGGYNFHPSQVSEYSFDFLY